MTQADKNNLYEMSKNLTYKQISSLTGVNINTVAKTVLIERNKRNDKRHQAKYDCDAKSLNDCLNCKFTDCINSNTYLMEFERKL